MGMPQLLVTVCALFISALTPLTSSAVAITYTSESDFLAALSGALDVRTLDFEAQNAGDQFISGTGHDGVIFDYAIPDFTMEVDDTFTTTSPKNYLGLFGKGSREPFLSGDSFTMTFDGRAVNAVGLYVIGEDILGGDFNLVTSAGSSVTNADTPDQMFIDGDAFFLGIIDMDSLFTSVRLDSFAPSVGSFIYNVDDITTAFVPLPGALILFGSGLFSLLISARRRMTH